MKPKHQGHGTVGMDLTRPQQEMLLRLEKFGPLKLSISDRHTTRVLQLLQGMRYVGWMSGIGWTLTKNGSEWMKRAEARYPGRWSAWVLLPWGQGVEQRATTPHFEVKRQLADLRTKLNIATAALEQIANPKAKMSATHHEETAILALGSMHETDAQRRADMAELDKQ